MQGVAIVVVVIVESTDGYWRQNGYFVIYNIPSVYVVEFFFWQFFIIIFFFYEMEERTSFRLYSV